MNLQQLPNGVEWTRVWGRQGYTWNPVQGCLHRCRWRMPDSTIAECYAETMADSLKSANFFPDGFQKHYWHPQRLDEPVRLRTPAGIFLDSVSDLMGHWVPDDQISAILDVCRKTPQHVYFLLTKNAPRLLQFEFPENVWAGVSSPPDFFMGKQLNKDQQRRMLSRSLDILGRVKAGQRWMSFEPLSWHVSEYVDAASPEAITWAVIGAASRGKKYFPPAEAHVRDLVQLLDRRAVPVFYKGNLRSLAWARQNWREDFPNEHVEPVERAEQLSLI